MKVSNGISNLVAAVVTLLAATSLALAHHSRTMFDMTKNVTYKCIVKEYRWQNPHSYIFVTVESGTPGASTISVEGSSISLSTSMGWNRTTFKAGDPITVVVHPGKTNNKEALLFYVINTDGNRLYRATHRYPSEAD